MKNTNKFLSVILIAIMLVGATSCNNKTSSTAVADSSEKTVVTTAAIDVDLSSLNSTMAYSQLSDMLSNTNNYLWKKVKITGSFGVYEPGDGRIFYACSIYDSTACCALSLEFIPPEGMKYPDDFPAKGDEITIEGEFTTYEDAGEIYATLKDATFVS